MSRHRAPAPAASALALITGVAAALATFILGFIAKTGPVARLDPRVDEHIAAHGRVGLLNALAWRRAGCSAAPPPRSTGSDACSARCARGWGPRAWRRSPLCAAVFIEPRRRPVPCARFLPARSCRYRAQPPFAGAGAGSVLIY